MLIWWGNYKKYKKIVEHFKYIDLDNIYYLIKIVVGQICYK